MQPCWDLALVLLKRESVRENQPALAAVDAVNAHHAIPIAVNRALPQPTRARLIDSAPEPARVVSRLLHRIRISSRLVDS